MSHTLRCLLIASLLLSVAGCRNYTWQDAEKSAEEKSYSDRDLKLSSEDYNKALAPVPVPEKASRGSALNLAPVVAEDQRDILPQPLVSVTVNQDVPIRDIFYELAKQAQVDLELDPDIRGSVIFTAYNRPFDSVVARLAEISGLRYKFENNVLRVEIDRPYMKVYRIDYMGMTRKVTSEIKSNTGVDASAIGASGGAGAGQNGSKSTITTDAGADFWKEVQTNLQQLLEVGRYEQRQSAKTAAPLTTPNAIPAVTTEQLASTGAAPAAQPSAPVPTGEAAKEEELKSSGGLGDPYFAINKQAGLINVFASEKQHKQVASYLKELRQSSNTQVLIEAKVLEVLLNNEYAMGIDWNQFIAGDLVLNAQFTSPNFLINPVTGGQAFNIGVNGNDFRLVMSALSRFGTARTLSSPRLTVMNNQSALLNVSENRVFFNLDITVQESGGINAISNTTINSEIKSVPEGIIINVHPTVDPDTNRVTMNLRPSVTRVVGQVADPSVAFVTAQAGITDITNNIPVVAVREMDSVVQMQSGETIIMGGLMQDSNQSSQTGVPVLGEIPVVGALFRNQGDMTKKTELVIMIKATVITPRPDETDKKIYKTFGADRRPIAMN
jgi:MSHA biogenesis protein MshL